MFFNEPNFFKSIAMLVIPTLFLVVGTLFGSAILLVWSGILFFEYVKFIYDLGYNRAMENQKNKSFGLPEMKINIPMPKGVIPPKDC